MAYDRSRYNRWDECKGGVGFFSILLVVRRSQSLVNMDHPTVHDPDRMVVTARELTSAVPVWDIVWYNRSPGTVGLEVPPIRAIVGMQCTFVR